MKDLIFNLKNKQLFLNMLLFLINPFISFLYNLKYTTKKSSLVIFFLFGALYAWSMDYHGTVHDFSRIVSDFYKNDLSELQFKNELDAFFAGTSDFSDIYLFCVTYITKLYSQNYHFFFFMASLPFMFFMVKSVEYIINDTKLFKNNFYNFVILLLFVLPYNIFFIEAPRFPTAVWITVFTSLKIFYEGKSKYFFLLITTPLIHSSFIIVTGVIFFIFLFRLKEGLLYKIYYITLPLLFVPAGWIELIDFSFLPDSLSRMINIYLSEEAFGKWGMQASITGSGFYWVSILFTYIRLVTYVLANIILIKNVTLTSKSDRNIFRFIIFFLIFVNILFVIPVLGGRLREFGNILTIFMWFKFANNIKYKKFLYIILAANTYEIFYKYYLSFSALLDWDFFFSNTIYLIIKHLNVATYNLY